MWIQLPEVLREAQSITVIPKCALVMCHHVGDSPGDHQHPEEGTELTVSEQDKLHTMWSRSGEASPELALLSGDLHRKNGGVIVLRTSKHHRELFPSTMPVI